MNEGEPKIELEHIPTMEELVSVLRELTKGEFKVSRALEDERGLFLVEVYIEGDAEGEKLEWTYTRKGIHSQNIQSLESEIHVAYYKDNFPVSGTSAARYIDGAWKILK